MKNIIFQVLQVILVAILAGGSLISYTEAKFASKDTVRAQTDNLTGRLDRMEIMIVKIYDHLIDK